MIIEEANAQKQSAIRPKGKFTCRYFCRSFGEVEKRYAKAMREMLKLGLLAFL